MAAQRIAFWAMTKKSRISSVRPPAPTATARPSSAPSHDEIAARAAALWREKGSPQGCDEEIWLQAERELRNRAVLERDERDAALLADPRFAFDKKDDDLMEELDAQFPDRAGDATSSL